MQVLADNGGYVLAEDGGRLLFFQRRIVPSWLVFVPGLLAIICAGNGIVQLVVGNVAAGLVILALGAVGLAGLRFALRARKRAMSAPLDPAGASLVVDLETATLRDARGNGLAPLTGVRFEKAMQATSSARSLRVTWAGGSLVLYRGDPLTPSGSIDAPARVLQERGLPVTW